MIEELREELVLNTDVPSESGAFLKLLELEKAAIPEEMPTIELVVMEILLVVEVTIIVWILELLLLLVEELSPVERRLDMVGESSLKSMLHEMLS